MALYTKKEFADRCGVETKNLSVYIKRGKVVVQPDGMINDSVSQNRLFIQKNQGQQTEKQIVNELKKKQQFAEAMEDAPIDEQLKVAAAKASAGERPPMDLVDSTEWLRYWDAQKREKENEKLELDNQKKRGETVPSEVVQNLIYRHNQNVMTQFKNSAEEIVRMMGHKYGMTSADMSEARGQILKSINSFMGKAKDESLAGLQNIVEAYQIKRGVGERK